jgi:hypothetical protein
MCIWILGHEAKSTIFFFLVVLGFELRFLGLLGSHSTTSPIQPALYVDFFFFGGTGAW